MASDGIGMWDRVSYKLNSQNQGETDSGVNSMDFHEKAPKVEPIRQYQGRETGQYQGREPGNVREPGQYRYQSHSVERPPSSQIQNVPARARIRSARTRAANIRSRSRGNDLI